MLGAVFAQDQNQNLSFLIELLTVICLFDTYNIQNASYFMCATINT